MNNTLNFKFILGIIYLVIFLIVMYFLFSIIDIKDLTNYEFIRQNKEVILEFKSKNFLFLTIIFFIFSIIWILLLGFAFPLLVFSGFIFGKWFGTLLVVTAITIGATLLYMLANFFFRNVIKQKLVPKFFRLKEMFVKNDILYYMILRFLGGIPFAIQNVLPILFDMSVKNYFIATFLGCMPTMFISVALGSGIHDIIDQNEKLTILTVLTSPEIYIPIIAFIFILFVAFVIRKLYFKQ